MNNIITGLKPGEMTEVDSPRLCISFEDRVGFVFDISRVIFNWGLNIISIEIQTGNLYIHLESLGIRELAGLVNELYQVPGVLAINPVSLMPSEEREKKIKAVLDAVSEGIVAVDTEGTITAINPVAEKIFQSSAAELLGKNLAEAFSPEAPILRCLRDGKPYNYTEVSLLTLQGRLNFLSTGRPLKDDRGNIIGAVACIKDMSDVKKLIYSMTKPAMTTFDEIIGISPAFVKALDLARMVARGGSTVLLRGESGTGKELFARAIHMESFRRGSPFVPVNCAALPDNLLESELFGYVEGAFTGAQKGGKVGLFEFANHGTLFLDEIGELSPHLQAKLLRVLQEGRVRRIGDRLEHPVNVRIVAATNRNLEEMIKNGDFREDLYYRLNVVPIHIPPLRQRKEDIPILTRYLVAKFRCRMNKEVDTVTSEAMQKLADYHWPGNIRELENVLERAMILAQEQVILPEHIILDRNYDGTPEQPKAERSSPEGTISGAGSSSSRVFGHEGITMEAAVDNFERQFLTEALQKYGTIRRTAKALGVSHTTIMNKIKKYGL